MPNHPCIVRYLGLTQLPETYKAMQIHNALPHQEFQNEIWVLEHHPIFTLGLNADNSHIHSHSDIPVLRIDRGGEVTYHGPGQLIIYPMLDLKRCDLRPLAMIDILESTCINWLKTLDLNTHADAKDRGVYLDSTKDKIASIGVRVKNGRTYHGIAINLNMDLSPFKQINPCGKKDMNMTQVFDILNRDVTSHEKHYLIELLAKNLNLQPQTINESDD